MQVLEECTGDLQRQLLLAQSELKAAREDAHIHDLDKSQMQAQLAGSTVHLRQFRCCTCCKSTQYLVQLDSGKALNAGSSAAVLYYGNEISSLAVLLKHLLFASIQIVQEVAR